MKDGGVDCKLSTQSITTAPWTAVARDASERLPAIADVREKLQLRAEYQTLSRLPKYDENRHLQYGIHLLVGLD